MLRRSFFSYAAVWGFKGGPSGEVKMTPEISQALEDHRNSNSRKALTLTSGKFEYQFDVRKMTQTNTETSRVRPLFRRSNGSVQLPGKKISSDTVLVMQAQEQQVGGAMTESDVARLDKRILLLGQHRAPLFHGTFLLNSQKESDGVVEGKRTDKEVPTNKSDVDVDDDVDFDDDFDEELKDCKDEDAEEGNVDEGDDIQACNEGNHEEVNFRDAANRFKGTLRINNFNVSLHVEQRTAADRRKLPLTEAKFVFTSMADRNKQKVLTVPLPSDGSAMVVRNLMKEDDLQQLVASDEGEGDAKYLYLTIW